MSFYSIWQRMTFEEQEDACRAVRSDARLSSQMVSAMLEQTNPQVWHIWLKGLVDANVIDEARMAELEK